MRIYVENEGKRHLAFLKCDGCGALGRPGPEVAGVWAMRGWDNGPGTEKFEQTFCVPCAEKAGG